MFLRVCYIFLFITLPTLLQAQENFAYNPWQKDTLITAVDNVTEISFPENYRILDQSFVIEKNKRPLEVQIDYIYKPESKKLNLFIPLRSSDSLHIHYTIQPILLKTNYTLFKVDTLKAGDLETDSLVFMQQSYENPFSGFDTRLKRSGSIFRGVNIGNTKDLTINAGLNLQISGYLTDDVEVIAALTDDATPIQPEGNTQSLREVDKVFIQFKSPWVTGTMGDFNLRYGSSQFATLSRKLQGVSMLGFYKSFQLGATVASTRGFFHFMSFLGREGNQGPYQLTGREGERDIIILAGTERIWINSTTMVRGENNDYIIDYATGQITFSNKRLITSESRIEVDFEYYPAVQKYTRNIYSGISEGKLFNNNIGFKIKYYQEKDDPEKILEQEGVLNEEEIRIIQEAGDDPLAASVDAVTYVGDSLGFYAKLDTLIDSLSYTYYNYVGEGLGDYRISFSSVGNGNGDYVRDRIGVYRWVGIGSGGYLPVTLLPLPLKHELADIEINYTPTDNFSITSEYAITGFDRNTLSDLGDSDNNGDAVRFTVNLKPTDLDFGGTSFGVFNFSANGKFIDDKFRGVDRINRPDFNRYWNILQDTPQTDEEKSWEVNSGYQPWKILKLQGNIGQFQRQSFESSRFRGQINFSQEDWFSAEINQEYVASRQGIIKNDWIRQKGKLEKNIGLFQPGVSFEREQRKNQSKDILSGFDFNVWGVYLSLINHTFLSGRVQYTERNDNLFDPNHGGAKLPQAKTQTGGLRINLNEWNRWSGHLEFVLRKKDFTPLFENIRPDSLENDFIDPSVQDTVWRDQETLLAELVVNNYQWQRALDIRWQYRISTEQLALREKIYVDVGIGRGNFRFDEQLDEYVPDPNGRYVLFIVPSNQFEPVTNMFTSLRLNIDPYRMLKKPESLFQKILVNINSESYFRVDEETKNRNLQDLYFLNLSKFQTAETIRGNITFNQDLYLMKRNRDLSFRLRYRYRDDLLNQFLEENENEDRLKIEKGIRANYRLFQKVRLQTEFRDRLTFRNNQAEKSRNRDISSLIFNQNISYRPNLSWEFGLESENGLEEDRAEGKNLEIQYNRFLFRTTYSILRKGRITANFDYQIVKVLSNPLNAPIPYEMARSKREGENKSWNFRAEYSLAENIVFTLSYNGRDDADFEKIIHVGQAEVRAFF